MDDPPITRLSGSKRFEHRASDTDPRGGGRDDLPSITWSSTFSLYSLLQFLFLFFFFFYLFCIFSSHNPTRPGPGSKKNGKLDDSWPTTTFGLGLSVAL